MVRERRVFYSLYSPSDVTRQIKGSEKKEGELSSIETATYYSVHHCADMDPKGDGGEEVDAKRAKLDVESRPRHNVFTAIQVTNPEVHLGIRRIHISSIESDPTLDDCLVSTRKAHVTLHAFHAGEERVGDLRAAMERAVQLWKRERGAGAKLQLHFRGLDAFREGKVVFANVSGNEALHSLHRHVTAEISGLDLERVRLHPTFRPHLTIIKVARAAKEGGGQRERIEEKHYGDFVDADLGRQECRSLQLVSMEKPPDHETGYYAKLAEVSLPCGEVATEEESGDHAGRCTPKPQRLKKEGAGDGTDDVPQWRARAVAHRQRTFRKGRTNDRFIVLDPRKLLVWTVLAVVAQMAIYCRNHYTL